MSENIYLQKLRNQVLEILKDEKVKVVLFGSRARKDYADTSDVDIGIIPYGKINQDKITIFRERIEDMNIPYKIEVVNFSEVSEDFKKEALKEVIIWKD